MPRVGGKKGKVAAEVVFDGDSDGSSEEDGDELEAFRKTYGSRIAAEGGPESGEEEEEEDMSEEESEEDDGDESEEEEDMEDAAAKKRASEERSRALRAKADSLQAALDSVKGTEEDEEDEESESESDEEEEEESESEEDPEHNPIVTSGSSGKRKTSMEQKAAMPSPSKKQKLLEGPVNESTRVRVFSVVNKKTPPSFPTFVCYFTEIHPRRASANVP